MATSGSFNTSSYSGRYLKFSWSIISQSTENNSTTISWTLDGAGGTVTDWYITGNIRLILDGGIVYQSTDTIKLYGNTRVASGTKTLWHIDNGNRSFSASASAGIYNWGGTNVSGGDSWRLPSIPRQATLTSSPNFNDEDNPTIHYSNPAGNAVTTLEACITSEDGNTMLADYRNISKTGGSYTFDLTTAERDNFRNYCKYDKSKRVKFFVTTGMAGNRYFSTAIRTIAIVNANPTVTGTIYDVNPKSIELTGDRNKLIKYISNAYVSCTPITKKLATRSGLTINNNGINRNDTLDTTFNNIESGVFNFYVTDSRGNKGESSITKQLIPYIKLTTNLVAKGTLDADNTAKILCSVNGNYFNATFGKTSNKLYSYYRYKEVGGQFSEWISTSSFNRINRTTYTCDFEIKGLSYKKIYVVQVAAEDKLSFITSDEQVVNTKPVCDWGAHDFNFNVPVSINGKEIKDFVLSYKKGDGWWKRDWVSGLTESYGEVIFFNSNNPNVLNYANRIMKAGFSGIMPIQVGDGALVPTTYCMGMIISNGSDRCTVVIYGMDFVCINVNTDGSWGGWRKLSESSAASVSIEQDQDAMLVDMEYKLALLELGLNNQSGVDV